MALNLTKEKVEDFGQRILQELNDVVFNNIYNYLREFPNQRKYLNPAFPYPKNVRIAILKDYFVVEYIGPEDDNNNNLEGTVHYQPTFDIYDFLELDFDRSKSPSVKINNSINNTNFFLGNSIAYLCDYFYDFLQKKEDLMLNGFINFDVVDKPIVVNNCTFFYTDKSDGLKIRHIDLLEIFPIVEDGIPYHTEGSLIYFSNYIISNKFPQYDVRLHEILNNFIELINLSETNETAITKFIEENPELLQLAFGFNKLNPQVNLIWQDRTGVDNLKPDFLPEDMSGYCNIMDFKLPLLKSKPIVGRTNRKQPSYEIDECIAQLDTYEEYCSQKINQDWLQNSYSIKIDVPQRYIIMGHSKDFSPEDRQKIKKHRKTTFFTYDEFIEMARYQIYRIK